MAFLRAPDQPQKSRGKTGSSFGWGVFSAEQSLNTLGGEVNFLTKVEGRATAQRVRSHPHKPKCLEVLKGGKGAVMKHIRPSKKKDGGSTQCSR